MSLAQARMQHWAGSNRGARHLVERQHQRRRDTGTLDSKLSSHLMACRNSLHMRTRMHNSRRNRQHMARGSNRLMASQHTASLKEDTTRLSSKVIKHPVSQVCRA